MITEITSKTILNHVKQPDPWFGQKFNMNSFRTSAFTMIRGQNAAGMDKKTPVFAPREVSKPDSQPALFGD